MELKGERHSCFTQCSPCRSADKAMGLSRMQILETLSRQKISLSLVISLGVKERGAKSIFEANSPRPKECKKTALGKKSFWEHYFTASLIPSSMTPIQPGSLMGVMVLNMWKKESRRSLHAIPNPPCYISGRNKSSIKHSEPTAQDLTKRFVSYEKKITKEK